MRGAVRICHRCSAADDTGDLAWALDREDGVQRRLCPDCARAHTRDIEARLPPQWWS
jgi:hypothetical protein